MIQKLQIRGYVQEIYGKTSKANEPASSNHDSLSKITFIIHISQSKRAPSLTSPTPLIYLSIVMIDIIITTNSADLFAIQSAFFNQICTICITTLKWTSIAVSCSQIPTSTTPVGKNRTHRFSVGRWRLAAVVVDQIELLANRLRFISRSVEAKPSPHFVCTSTRKQLRYVPGGCVNEGPTVHLFQFFGMRKFPASSRDQLTAKVNLTRRCPMLQIEVMNRSRQGGH